VSNFLILMSGGTTPVINATLSGIVEAVKKKKKKVYSGLPGINGVLVNKIVNLTDFSKSKISNMGKTPGSHFIGTTRLKKLTNKEIHKLEENLIKKNIKNIINIGGNGTLKQSIDLSKRLKNFNFISCPKTVDNDLGDCSFKKLLFNPGFISCAMIWKFFLEMINIENVGAQSHDKIIVSQTFGRDTGFICGSIRYWDRDNKLPIMLLLPEDIQSFSNIFKYSKKMLKKHGRLMIFLSEGYKVGNIKPKHDKSGQVMYGSSGNTNCQILSNKFMQKGIQSRIFNPTILQRVFKFRNIILNKKDILIAKQIGTFAAKMLFKNKRSILVGISDKNKVISLPYSACTNYSRKMPSDFIIKNKFNVSKKYLNYLDKVFK